MTISLELSKKLAGAGLKIETEKWWITLNDGTEWFIAIRLRNEFLVFENNITWETSFDSIKDKYPAPSTDELLVVMPKVIGKRKYLFEIHPTRDLKGWMVGYYAQHKEWGDNLPEALGKMCLWLLENGYHYNPETKMITREK